MIDIQPNKTNHQGDFQVIVDGPVKLYFKRDPKSDRYLPDFNLIEVAVPDFEAFVKGGVCNHIPTIKQMKNPDLLAAQDRLEAARRELSAAQDAVIAAGGNA